MDGSKKKTPSSQRKHEGRYKRCDSCAFSTAWKRLIDEHKAMLEEAQATGVTVPLCPRCGIHQFPLTISGKHHKCPYWTKESSMHDRPLSMQVRIDSPTHFERCASPTFAQDLGQIEVESVPQRISQEEDALSMPTPVYEIPRTSDEVNLGETTNSDQTAEMTFCTVCWRTLQSEEDLSFHQIRDHPLIHCPICMAVFPDEEQKQLHISAAWCSDLDI